MSRMTKAEVEQRCVPVWTMHAPRAACLVSRSWRDEANRRPTLWERRRQRLPEPWNNAADGSHSLLIVGSLLHILHLFSPESAARTPSSRCLLAEERLCRAEGCCHVGACSPRAHILHDVFYRLQNALLDGSKCARVWPGNIFHFIAARVVAAKTSSVDLTPLLTHLYIWGCASRTQKTTGGPSTHTRIHPTDHAVALTNTHTET